MSSATVEKPMASESAICQAGGGSVTMRAIIVIGADRKSTRLNSSHSQISYAVFCLKKKKKQHTSAQRTNSSPRSSRTPHRTHTTYPPLPPISTPLHPSTAPSHTTPTPHRDSSTSTP